MVHPIVTLQKTSNDSAWQFQDKTEKAIRWKNNSNTHQNFRSSLFLQKRKRKNYSNQRMKRLILHLNKLSTCHRFGTLKSGVSSRQWKYLWPDWVEQNYICPETLKVKNNKMLLFAKFHKHVAYSSWANSNHMV